MKYYENFLLEKTANSILKECLKISKWKDFNRNTSHMKEYYDEESPFLKHVRKILHSKDFVKWIEEEIQIYGLVTDSFGVGEGVSLMQEGDELNPHIDFNWNERIKMYRAVNLLIYFGECEGGEFHVWDDNKENIIFEKEPKHNSAIIFTHSETKAHGVKPVKSGNRFAIRQFYYKSDNICNDAHQSLYWYNPNKKMETNSVE
jgi:Rps23 Pro-64 3,4-dihydroxylase Tpa1-like proline 4-hydroxylase